MPVVMHPYIHFNGEAKPALEYYKDVFGGTVELSTYTENDMGADSSAQGAKIKHGVLESDDLTLMAADAPQTVGHDGRISLSLSGEDEPKLEAYFNRLSSGGAVTMPLAEAPWGDRFGMCTDKFGVNWMVNITVKKAAL